ncbi:MAG TPA: hypothetical protein VEZ40_14060, partial [Pyrinomonadaceae bacterium]|nr:hypothetical protein [Pyrinomonadaceae bacterium]
MVDKHLPNACGKHRKDVIGRWSNKPANFSSSVITCQRGTAIINGEWPGGSNSASGFEVFGEFAFEQFAGR